MRGKMRMKRSLGCRWRRLFTAVILMGLARCAIVYTELAESRIKDLCVHKCSQGYYRDELNTVCDKECQSTCADGCRLWKLELSGNCSHLCEDAVNIPHSTADDSGTTAQCLNGCQTAVSLVMQEVAGNSSLQLSVEWHRTRTPGSIAFRVTKNDIRLPTVFSRVQFRYPGDEWQYYTQQEMFEIFDQTASFIISGFKPYTMYQFRLAWSISESLEALYTIPQNVTTQEYGPPQGPPQKVTCALSSYNQVAVSWRPPPFPAGPEVSYLLEARKTYGGTPFVHELITYNSTCDQTFSYLFRELLPNTGYIVNVQAANRNGRGMSASCQVNTTDMEKESVNRGQGFAASGGDLYKFDLSDTILGRGHVVFSVQGDGALIRGVTGSLQSRELYVSDNHGRIHVVGMDRSSSDRVPRTLSLDVQKPSLLSYDWLNKRLFVFDESSWEIKSCTIEQRFICAVVVDGFSPSTAPKKLIVDSYNGYLFWMAKGAEGEGSAMVLYRVDLIVAEENTKLHWDKAEVVHQSKGMKTFAVEYAQSRLHVLDSSKDSIYAINMDSGNIVSKVRDQWAFYSNGSDIVFANEHFYVATTDGFFVEDGPTPQVGPSYRKFNNFTAFRFAFIDHKTAEPIPSPATPPENVRALFGSTFAKIFWDVPRPLTWQGKGAFRKFLYTVDVTDLHTGKEVEHIENVKRSQLLITWLRNATKYRVTVRAHSELRATGPPSSGFVGSTLKSDAETLVWSTLMSSTAGGLKRYVFASDATGDEAKMLVSSMQLQNNDVNAIAWLDDTLFLGHNRTSLISVNLGNGLIRELPEVTGVTCLGIDSYARKVYWGSLTQRAIMRCDMEGLRVELVTSNVVAHSLAVDSARGLIIWADQFGVYTANLSGKGYRALYETHISRGFVVQGLVYDSKRGVAISSSRSIDGLELRMDSIDRNGARPVPVQMNDTSLRGPVIYLDDRLIWLDRRSQPVITSLDGSFPAAMQYRPALGHGNGAFEDGSSDSELGHRDFPEALAVATKIRSSKIMVIPKDIKDGEIKVEGTYDNFTIRWPQEQSLHVAVFYRIRVTPCSQNESDPCCSDNAQSQWSVTSSKVKPLSLNTNRHVYPDKLRPHTRLAVQLQPYTDWANAKSVCHVLRSPESTPSAPQTPKVFVAHRSVFPKYKAGVSYPEAEFRWSDPEHPNGFIKGYILNAWYRRNSPYLQTSQDTEPAAEVKLDNRIDQNNLQQAGEDSVIVWKNVRVSGHSYSIPKLVPNSTYFFKVSAFTSIGEGPASTVLSINSDDEMPVPRLLVVDQQEAAPEADSPANRRGQNSLGKGIHHSSVQVSDVDNGNVTVVSNKVTNPIGVAFLDDTVFWLEQRGPIMSSAMDGSNISVVHSTLETGTSLAVDWVGRRLYWVEYDGTNSIIFVLDLADGRSVKIVLEIPKKYVSSIAADPFSSSLVFTVSSQPSMAASIMLVQLDGLNKRQLFSPRRRRSSLAHLYKNGTVAHGNTGDCTCLSVKPITRSVVALDAQSKKGPGTIYFADAEQGNIWRTDLVGCHCHLVANASLTKGLPPDVLTVDLQRVYWSQRGREEVFSILKDSLGRPTHGKTENHVAAVKVASGVRNIRALNSQHYPDPMCMEISAPSTAPAAVGAPKHSSLQVELFPPEIAKECSKISRPTVRYIVKYKKTKCLGTLCHREKQSLSATPVLQDLESYTNYTISYYYIDPYSQKLHGPSPPALFQTDDAEPGPAQFLSAVPLTPDSLEIRWTATLPSRTRKPPRYELRYWEADSMAKREQKRPSDIKNFANHGMNLRAHNSNRIDGNETLFSRNFEELADNNYTAIISDLKPSTIYKVEVVAVNVEKPEMRSAGTFVSSRTFDAPSDLTARNIGNRTIELTWSSSKKVKDRAGQESFRLEYSLEGRNWRPLAENRSSTLIKPDFEHSLKVSGLTPYTDYWFRLRITYRSEYDRRLNFTWPFPSSVTNETASGFRVRTKEDVPELPGQPRFTGPETNLTWEKSASNSGANVTYELQARQLDINTTQYWKELYIGDENHYDAYNLSSDSRYLFRVRAINPNGSTDWVQTKKPLAIPAVMVIEKISSKSVIGIVLPSLLILILGVIMAVERFSRRRSATHKQPHGLCPPVELITLRGLPYTSNFVQQHNELYTFCDVPLTDGELASIPTIDREQIRLNQLLGSGAFGDVYEGVLYGDTAQKIAVKMLRKGANELEKAEFLKEAKLMSNFRHPHILTLLGISFDFNMSFIIMELMEDGDLLSVLRSCRNSSVGDPEESVGLTLEDLLSMCVDISKGCKYLEEMRFVHRDLAARNCLVASETLEDGRVKRVVKIGDFGLARDVYKSDYYRKEGEGLLPVRWMAPEALLDGVFTNYTDVWAFGVLTWEVLSLGQQPYPAMSNVDVLNYVRAGGVLACLPGCPVELYALMCRCWSYTPEERPKFYHLLAELEKLQTRVQSLTLPAAGTLGGSSSAFHNGTAPPTQYNYIIPPTTAAAEHYQQHQLEEHNQAHYNKGHRLGDDGVTLRRDKPRPHSMELLGSVSSGSYDVTSSASTHQKMNAKTLTLQRASFANLPDDEIAGKMIGRNLNELTADAQSDARLYLTLLPPSTSDGSAANVTTGTASEVSSKTQLQHLTERNLPPHANSSSSETATNRTHDNNNHNRTGNKSDTMSSAVNNKINGANEKLTNKRINETRIAARSAEHQVPPSRDHSMDHPVLIVGGATFNRSRPDKSATLGHMTGLNNHRSYYSQYPSLSCLVDVSSGSGHIATGRRGCPTSQATTSNGVSQQKSAPQNYTGFTQTCPVAGLIMSSAATKNSSRVTNGAGHGSALTSRWGATRTSAATQVTTPMSPTRTHLAVGTTVHNQAYNHVSHPAQHQQKQHQHYNNNNKSNNNNPSRFVSYISVGSGEAKLSPSEVMPTSRSINSGKPDQIRCQLRQFLGAASQKMTPLTRTPAQLHKVNYEGIRPHTETISIHQGGDSNNNSYRTASWC